MRKYPQLELLQICREKATEIKGVKNIYEFLPMDEVPYPFFLLGEQQTVERLTKQAIFPSIFQTIHYYGYLEKRGTAILHCGELMDGIRSVKETEDYRVNIKNIDFRILEDKTTTRSLLHCVIDVEAILY